MGLRSEWSNIRQSMEKNYYGYLNEGSGDGDGFQPDPHKSVVKNFEDFAEFWHHKAGNFRRGPEHIPYIEHPKKVADVLRRWGFTDEKNPITLCVAYGHDLIEEAHVHSDEIMKAGGSLGKAILGGIKMLTFRENPLHESPIDREKDKAEYIARVAKEAPLGILAVKIADRLCNTMDFVQAKKPYAHKYLKAGEPLFARVKEFPNGEVIERAIEAVKERVNRLPKPKDEEKKVIAPTKDKFGRTIYPEVRKGKWE